MNVTPYLTGTGNFKRPFEHTYMDPVYDMSDLDDDGVLDNPGDILYYCLLYTSPSPRDTA